jgi:hypothetical protein
MPQGPRRCPACDNPDPNLDRDGKITLHHRWTRDDEGHLYRLTGFCTAAVGSDPLEP